MQGDSSGGRKRPGMCECLGWEPGEEGLGQGELRGRERPNRIVCEEMHE